jgi:hypothetical protein
MRVKYPKKYPRTLHLPYSYGRSSDDRVLDTVDHFAGREVVVTVKMDGENTTVYRDGFHARSVDSRHHPSRDWLANFVSTFAHDIPEGWRICGENLYARHSIAYTQLPSYFMGFSVWSGDLCHDWDSTVEFFELLGIEPVPTLYRGVFDAVLLERMARELDTSVNEGFVVRLADSFEYSDFGSSVAKWVRASHVQSDKHWMHGAVVPNGIKA